MRPSLFSLLLLCSINGFVAAQNDPFPEIAVSTESTPSFSQHIKEIVKVGSNLFALFPDPQDQYAQIQLFKSADNGAHWTMVSYFNLKKVVNILAKGDTLFAFTEKLAYPNQFIKGYYSKNGGATFTEVFTKTEPYNQGDPNAQYFYPEHLEQAGGILFFNYRLEAWPQKYYKRFYSADKGATWQAWTHLLFTSRQSNKIMYANGWFLMLCEDATVVYASQTPDFANVTSINLGVSFTEDLISGHYDGTTLYIVAKSGKVFSKTNPLTSGNFQFSALPFTLNAALVHNGHFHYYNNEGALYRATVSQPTNVTMTMFCPSTYDASNYYAQYPIRDFASVGNSLFLLSKTPIQSDDNGATWHFPQGEYPPASGSLYHYGDKFWMQQGFLGRLENNIWVPYQPQGLPVDIYRWESVVEAKGFLFVSNKYCCESILYRSADGGDSWTQILTTNPLIQVKADIDGENLYNIRESSGAGVFRSTDAGVTWSLVPGAPASTSMVAKGDSIFIVHNKQLHFSYNVGQTWHSTPLAHPVANTQNAVFEIFYQKGRLLIVDKMNGQSYISLDAGVSFIHLFDFSNYDLSFHHIDSLLVISSGGRTYVSNNLGLSGINFFDTDWKSRKTYAVKDGYLYSASAESSSNAILSPPMRTALMPILDSLMDAEFGIVQGEAFLDENQNCVRDASDVPIPGQTFVFQPGNYLAVSDAQGMLRRILPPGNYSVAFTPPTYTLTGTCFQPPTITTHLNNTSSFTAGFVPVPTKDLSVTVTGTNLRPGFVAYYTITVRNLGTVTVAGGTTLYFNYPESLISYLSATPSPSGVQGGELLFLLPEIPPFTDLVFHITMHLPPDPSITGQQVITGAGIQGPYTDVNLDNHITRLITTITNSLDPNDKTAYTVAPNGELPLANKELSYLIRFQNTGTDTAFRVVVVDTLSPLLDWASLRTITASHPFKMNAYDPGVISWQFDNILLPDSTTNERASHGFVLFSIRAKESTTVGDTLKNDAAIYFDFNYPVITNQTQTHVVRRLTIYRDMPSANVPQAFAATVSPNPVGQILQWNIKMVLEANLTAFVTDGSGKQVHTLIKGQQIKAGEHSWAQDIGALPAGNYWLQIRFDGRNQVIPFVKI
ncbi:MAG: hypothetical protein H7246_11600 [Phycisphaerae bacterium]|nr:hypothetical protein [Saprospiraceae bacterium]